MRPLYKEFRVNEFLRIAAKLHNIPAKKINSSIDIAMEKCGLTHMSNRLIENLSNGYQQRVGIAQAIIHNPEIVILDEPTVGLDPIQIREIRKLIKEIGKEHSVILSTHILPEVEIVCDRVQIIDKGNLVFHGSIDDLKQQRRGNKLLVGFKKTPTLKKLQSLFDIVKIEKQEDLLHVIQFKNLDFDMEKFIQVCVKEKLGLFQVSPHITSLEDTFVQLTNK
jgi:ABC-2 type transport system ATP-binding protein